MAKWDKIRNRGNVKDRRGRAPVMGSIGVAGIVMILAAGYFGGTEGALQVAKTLNEFNQQSSVRQTTQQGTEFAGNDSYENFASTVLGSNDALWSKIFKNINLRYLPPTLVLFRGVTESSCGGADSRSGPHYCPVDKTIYLDETFFDKMTATFGAKGGDVAEAYVISHEVGHHVQTLLGTSEKVRKLQRKNPRKSNEYSVRQELQADCYAGVWANSISKQGVLEFNEISEAIDAAESVGDDRIQRRTRGRSHPESWTHGSSADRKKWFKIGYKYGDPRLCETFS